MSNERKAKWVSDYEHVAFDEDEQAASDEIKRLAVQLGHRLNMYLHDSRERSLAKTKLEECVMWANRAIGKNGLRNSVKGKEGE